MDLCCLVHDLVHRQSNKVTKHDIDDGTHARHRHAYPHAGNACLGDGCVNHTRGSKFFDQARKHFEWCASFGYVFTHHEDPWVAPHFLG